MAGTAMLFFSIAPAVSQDAPGNEQGIFPSRTYHGTDLETVNVATGRAVVHIPLLEDHSQRGQLNFTYSLSLTTSGNWSWKNFAGYTKWQLPKTRLGMSFVMDGWPSLVYRDSYTDPDFGYKNYAWFVEEASGAKHPLGGSPACCTSMETIDGSGFKYTTDSARTNRQGIRFYGNSIEDPNGNELTNVVTTTMGVPTFTDTLGRSWTMTSASSDVVGCPVAAQSSNLWAIPGPNGSTRTFKFCYSNISLQTHFNFPNIQEISWNSALMTGVVLPNSKTYRFDYDTYGDLIKITLPTGGSMTYTLQNSGPICSAFANAARVVTSRTIYDGATSNTWTYNGGVVTDPLGNDTAYSSNNCQDVNQIGYYSGSHTSGTLLKTVTKTYQQIADPFISEVYQNDGNAPTLLLSTTTTWANAQASQETQTYDSGFTWSDASNTNLSTGRGDTTPYQGFYGLATSKRKYDYANGSPGPLLSTINTNYLSILNSTYLTANILDLPSSVITLNASGYKCAETDYAYDDSTRLFSSGVTEQHAAAPNSVRGNLSSTTQQLSATPCQSNASWTPITSYHNVYDTGEVYQPIDPLTHTTTHGYSPTYYGAYATTLANALNQSTTHVYDFNTGLLTFTTDANNLTTSLSYDDMLRLTQAIHPDGGQETITYQESAYPFTTTVSTPINPSQNKTITNLFDGLGRLTQSQLTSDPQGTVFTDTTYDAVGQVHSVSNPYRTGTDITTTTGTTTYGYDALGRKTSETYPGSPASVLTTAYCGPSTLVTDPTGRWRRSRVDGLGRLVEVDEPNAPGASVNPNGCPGTGEPIWVTIYGYDTLGNLTSVLQNGSRQRSFTYDSLSRLLTATNPETGTITYAYNNDGALISKTDARNITTNYSPSDSPIDVLHRVTRVTYSNGDPSLTFAYDQANCLSLSTCQNIGHRTSMTDAAGSEAWSFQVDATNHQSVHKNQRTTSGITKTTTYVLDYAGNTTQATYPTGPTGPSGRVVNYTFDSANRPSSVQDASNGITYAAGPDTSPGGTCVADVTCYTPQGTFYALSIGETASFTGLNLTHIYNSRLQPLEFKASSTGGNAIDISYNFVDPVSGKNAGHVYGITNNLDSSRSQTFSHDQLNRITAAQTTSNFATSPSHCWQETYNLDPWANMQSLVANTNSSYTGCPYETGFTKTADGNNHLSGFSYDTSGNTTADGFNSYTWNAESQLKSGGGVNYLYDGDGRRVAKVGSKLYWYDGGSEILAETDASGNATAEYIFFGGQRIAMIPSSGSPPVAGNPIYYVEDLLGTSRVITTNTGVVCYDADFYPYGGERAYTNTCPQNYKFDGKERDTETSNDDFGARYYSNRFGRWLSADWSAVPVPVPYANLNNPQTLNLYSMVADDPESFADLDGHQQPEPEAEKDPKEEIREEAELKEIFERVEAKIEEREAREAADIADAHQRFVNEQGGYDDPLGRACYAPDPNAGRPTMGPSNRTADDPLRRDANGKAIPDPDAKGAPHTQLGTRTSRSQAGNPKYRQGMEFDKDGKPVRQTDHTDHGRPDTHSNPHYHDIDPATGRRDRTPRPVYPGPKPPPPKTDPKA
jgi:RHS repeat-associated protein